MARDRSLTPDRRQFVSAALIGLAPKSPSRISGGFVFESQDRGHRIRDRAAYQPRGSVKTQIVIAGGGIAGLCAAWWLQRSGFRDFVLLEMEQQAGGNSRWGQNEVSAYPWSAHYLPVPDTRETLTRELCQEFGLLNSDGSWDERHLCHSPQERLFIHGRWQEGLEPVVGLDESGAAQYRRFEQLMAEYRATGAFRIPMEEGLARNSAKERALDGITFSHWLEREGLTSAYLRWYADYATRDDYGTRASEASAWAGIHYFASRAPEDKGPLTWAQGNGWFVQKLMARVEDNVKTGALVRNIRREGSKWRTTSEHAVYVSDFVIYALPTWMASYLVEPAPPRWPLTSAPWLIANLTLDRWPDEKGLTHAWDNVVYGSPSLGYVVATHQDVRVHQPRTVWTYYYALSEGTPAAMRGVLLGGDWKYWSEKILADLEVPHPDIRQCVSRIDIYRNGHAMPRPVPGAIFNEERMRRARPQGSFVYANSDLSALSLFEEAQYRGVTAARHVLRQLRRS